MLLFNDVPTICVIYPRLRTRQKVDYTAEELESQVLLMKDWCRHRMAQHTREVKEIKQVQIAQENALSQLRAESEELYQQAIQVSLVSCDFVAMEIGFRTSSVLFS